MWSAHPIEIELREVKNGKPTGDSIVKKFGFQLNRVRSLSIFLPWQPVLIPSFYEAD